MCMFSRLVEHVSGTKIFAAALPDGRQSLVYSMSVAASEDLAMVLPLPVPPGPPEEAVRFVSLEGYASFFEDVAKAFPRDLGLVPASLGAPRAKSARPRLEVHDVGAFDASFVPTSGDFDRLDPRFRLPSSVLDALPIYEDYGFAVFALKATARAQRVHPMAFTFPRRDPGALFFPTVHVHDGGVPERATFDHTLYVQPDGLVAQTLAWARSSGALSEQVDVARAGPLVRGDHGGFRLPLSGALPNRDVVVAAPAGLSRDDLVHQGAHHEARLRVGFAYMVHSDDARQRAWRETSRSRAPDLARALRDRIPALLEANARAWHLAAYSKALPEHFMNGSQVWRGSTWLDGKRNDTTGPGRLLLGPWSERVEPQLVDVAFERVPDDARAAEIQHALTALLEFDPR